MSGPARIQSIAQLTSNIFEVLKTKGTFLGRDCEILSSNPDIPITEVATSIEQVYDRIIAENPKPRFLELTSLKGALRLYGWMVLLQKNDISFATCECNPEFSQLLAKIDRACASISANSELSSSLRRCFDQLYHEFSKLSRDEFFQPKRLEQVRRILSLLLADIQLKENIQDFNFKMLPHFFKLRDFIALIVDQEMKPKSLQAMYPFPENEPLENGWPVTLLEAIGELGEEDFGLTLALSSIMNSRKEGGHGLGSSVVVTETKKRKKILENYQVLIEALKNPNVKPILRDYISYICRSDVDASIIGFPGKFHFPKQPSSEIFKIVKKNDDSSALFPWEKEIGFFSNNRKQLEIDCLKNKSVHEEKWKITSLEYREVTSLIKKREALEKKKGDLTEKIIVPMTQKRQEEGSDVASIDKILESANQKLTELNLELKAVKDRLKEETGRVALELSKERIELTSLMGFKDLPRAQEHFEELDASFADYERLYDLLRSRLFDTTGLSKEAKRRALEVQRPLFSDNTDPIFPETIGFRVEPEVKVQKLESSWDIPNSKTSQKKKDVQGSAPSTSKKASSLIEEVAPVADNTTSIPIASVSLSESAEDGKIVQTISEKKSKTQKGKEVLVPNPSPSISMSSVDEGYKEESSLAALSYASWVSDWFTSPEKALARPQYANIQPYPKVLAKVQAYHTFPLEIDRLLSSHGIESTWQDTRTGKDLIHSSIPCEIEFWDDKEVQRGSIGYCANQRGEYFHRCFSQKAPNEMVSEFLQKGFWNVDYPTLSSSLEQSQMTPGAQMLRQLGNNIRQINSYTLEIHDPQNRATIRIFNMKQFQEKE